MAGMGLYKIEHCPSFPRSGVASGRCQHCSILYRRSSEIRRMWKQYWAMPFARVLVPGPHEVAWRRSIAPERKVSSSLPVGNAVQCPGTIKFGNFTCGPGAVGCPALVLALSKFWSFFTDRWVQCPRSIHCTCKGKLIADGFSDWKKPRPFVRASK